MRYLSSYITRYLGKKVTLISGPRQVGKTTLAKSLGSERLSYFNYDSSEQRSIIRSKEWPRSSKLLILDELHKMKGWKEWLKGVIDTDKDLPPTIVIGSARLDIAKKMGDSLAGRHFHYRLHPLCLKELSTINHLLPGSLPASNFERLLEFGGFPEPFIEGDPVFSLQWRRSHLDLILRQDMLDIEQVREIVGIETLIHLLRDRVGTPVSYSSLSADLKVSPTTIKRWILILERLFVIFSLQPWHRNIARALQKTPKYYFFDTAQLPNDPGKRYENLVACALIKEVCFREDTQGESWQLSYLRDRDGHEIDFLLTNTFSRRALMVETKLSDEKPSKNFLAFSGLSKDFSLEALQLVPRAAARDVNANLKIRDAITWLSAMEWGGDRDSLTI